MRSRGLLLLVAVFLLPYFFAVCVSRFHFRLPDDVVPLLLRSLLQAVASSALALAFGVVGAVGLLRRSLRWEALAIFPAVVPSIAIVLGFMSMAPNWRGWSAVAVAHAAVSSGLVAVALSRAIRNVLGGSLELAWVEGASRRVIWFRGVLPAVKGDLARLALAIFAASLASFSIPLLLGGVRAVSIEIAILQAIRLEDAWDIAASLSILQMAMLVSLVLILAKSAEPDRSIESESRQALGRILGSDLAFATLFVVPFGVIAALLHAPLAGFRQLETAGLFANGEFLVLAFRGSVVTATLAGIFTALILFAFAAVFPAARWRKWISGYAAPSVAITGFATLAIGWGATPSFALDSFRIAIGAGFLFAPVLWRLRFEQRLAGLQGQVSVAETLGASHLMIVHKVLWPQLREVLFWAAGLVAFWVWGDYAIGSISASRAMTLALVAKGLLESYRFEAASILILVCLVLGAISYRLFSMAGGSRVNS